MTSFTLLEALSSISDAYIDEAARRPGRFRRYLAIAVSCALVAGVAAFGFAIPRMGANDSASPGGANAGPLGGRPTDPRRRLHRQIQGGTGFL